MKKIITLSYACLLAYLAYDFVISNAYLNPYPVLCDLVAEKIFLESKEIEKWKDVCLSRSPLVKPNSQRKLIIKDMNNVLGLLNVSHLEVYDSEEVRNIWQGDSRQTGIESDFVDGELVIFKVYKGSPAEKMGLKMGDILKSINGDHPSPWDAKSKSGRFVIRRSDQESEVQLDLAEVRRDLEVSVSMLKSSVGLIRVPSFRSDFFTLEKVYSLGRKISELKTVIIDLRGNEGGNFVAGLRFLSLFICQPTSVGELIRPRFLGNGIIEMPNVIEDQQQLDLFYKNREVKLVTFLYEPCFRGDLRVLIDSKSASVSEMVAQALKEVRGGRTLGSMSRGQLLVGVWYPLPEVGAGVELSIPEGIYISRGGRRIEGNGVLVDKILYYDLKEMQSGVDSWVLRAQD
jgi:carboxyl-terminal processing protease